MAFALGILLASTLSVSLSAGEYSELVETYRNGSFEQAVQLLSAADVSDIRERLGDFRPSTESQRMAAVLLHSEVAMRDVAKESVHLEAAETYLKTIENRDFIRRWRLLIARHYRGLMRPWNAAGHLEAARELFPQDLEIEMQSGVAYEVAGWLGSDKMLENAESMYLAVVARDADHAEAHLRLGRVRELRGDIDGAIAEIEKSLALSDDPRIHLPGNLLLGDLEEGRGNLDQAIPRYTAAVSADPRCQPAAVALGYALYRTRNFSRSREVIEAFFGSGPSETDHWWRYLHGDRQLFERHLSELREEVRR